MANLPTPSALLPSWRFVELKKNGEGSLAIREVYDAVVSIAYCFLIFGIDFSSTTTTVRGRSLRTATLRHDVVLGPQNKSTIAPLQQAHQRSSLFLCSPFYCTNHTHAQISGVRDILATATFEARRAKHDYRGRGPDEVKLTYHTVTTTTTTTSWRGERARGGRRGHFFIVSLWPTCCFV